MASEEIEIKFLCEARDLDAVLAAAPGDGTQTRTLVSTYYDTPDSVLSRGHVSLRIRQAGDRRIQTLKRGEGFARDAILRQRPHKPLTRAVVFYMYWNCDIGTQADA